MSAGDSRTPVAVLGATGLVGQHLVRLLTRHPWFRLAEVVASGARSGQRYDASVAWAVGGDPPSGARSLPLLAPGEPLRSPVVLSALPSAAAFRLEPALAWQGHRISSNASAFRMDPEVPLLIPEVNPTDVATVDGQPWAQAGGSLVTNPNCVVAGLVPVLAPIHRRWGLTGVTVSTLQALSGAGLSGPGALVSAGNVVPWIEDEEEKIAAEARYFLGSALPVDVAVTRVPVPHGHTVHVFLGLERHAEPAEVASLLRHQGPGGMGRRLPGLPRRTFHVTNDRARPQPRLDLDRGRGMRITVGGIRSRADHRLALTLLVHNLVRGAAGACLANAELVEVHRKTVPRALARGTA